MTKRLRRLFDSTDTISDATRRQFMVDSARTLLGVASIPLLGGLATAAPAGGGLPRRARTARNVIYLYMNGGMSQLDTFDPKPGASTQGPTESIVTPVDGVRVGQHFVNVARHMDKLCLFRGMTSTQGAHAQGRYFMHTSYELRGTIQHPTMGAWLDHLIERDNPALPGHVAIGGGQYTASAGFLESVHGPLPIGDPEAGLQDSRRPKHVDEETASRRHARLAQMNARFAERHGLDKGVRAYADVYEQSVRLMGSSELAAFDITQEADSVRAAYGDDKFGNGCLLARRLVEHGVRFVEVVSDGWDTHNQNFERMDDLCPPLDRAIGALLTDLEIRGLLDDTLVVLATEFGRTPTIVSGQMGRNHYPKAFTCWMAGGGVRGGTVHGRTDDEGHEVVEHAVTIPDFNATIAWAAGLPLDHVVTSPSGRPFTVADKGTAVFA